MDGRRLYGLDALRGIAALCVLLCHLPEYGAPFRFAHGFMAVDFFFMLSGYLMARTYGGRLGKRLGPGAFLKKRLRRLWPVAAIGMAISLPLLASYPSEMQLLLALSALLLIPALGGGYLFPSNASAWSISFELFANWLHGAVLWRLRRRTLAALALACYLCLVPAAFYWENLNLGPLGSTVLPAIPRVVFAYVVGMLIWDRFGDTPPVVLPQAVTLAAMPVLFFFFTGPLFDLAFVALAAPLLLVAGIRCSPPRALVFLGWISYPLYAVQIPVLDLSRGAGLPWQAGALLAVVLATAIAWLAGRSWGAGWVAMRLRLRAGA